MTKRRTRRNPYVFLQVDGTPVETYDLDTTPLTASDLGAYTMAQTDAAISAAFVNPTITGATLVDPKTAMLKEPNGGNAIELYSVVSAANYISFRAGVAGSNGVSFEANGSDSTVDINFTPKGPTPAMAMWTGSAANGTLKAAGSSADVGWNVVTKGAGTAKVNGVLIVRRTIQSLTASATLAADGDRVVLIGSGGAPTLPTAVGNTCLYRFRNVHTASRTIATTSSQTIDGSTTLVLPPGSSVDVVSDGSNWVVL